MKEAEKTPNVVKATNRKGLYEELEDIQKRLAVCEKALADYLETKRLAFPRFYFISSSDLLDILSKGNQPVQVSLNIKKCSKLPLKRQTPPLIRTLIVSKGVQNGSIHTASFSCLFAAFQCCIVPNILPRDKLWFVCMCLNRHFHGWI